MKRHGHKPESVIHELPVSPLLNQRRGREGLLCLLFDSFSSLEKTDPLGPKYYPRKLSFRALAQERGSEDRQLVPFGVGDTKKKGPEYGKR